MNQDSTQAGIPSKAKLSEHQPTYVEKTSRIQAWSQLIKAITPFIWLLVILVVIIPLIGRAFIANLASQSTQIPQERTEVMVERSSPDRHQLDRAVIVAVKDARLAAEAYASDQLDEWVNRLMTRVDESFLDWYFNYSNQKKIEFSTPFIWLSAAFAHSFNADNPVPKQAIAEKLTEEFQTEFAKRVLRPKIAQLELEGITRDTIERYVNELSTQITQVQSSYSLPQGQWERYLNDIAVTIEDAEGNVSNLSLKILAGGSTYLVAKAMLPVVTKVGSKVAAAFAGKASAKLAAKTGSAVATKLGGLLDPMVAIGILLWDLWDYQHSIYIERPILREAIFNYLIEVKRVLLSHQDNSIMSAIHQIETGLLKSLGEA